MKMNKINSGKYWRERVKTLARAAVRQKMKQAKVTEEKACQLFARWVMREAGISHFSPGILTVDECRRIVCLLHRYNLVFKN